MYSNSDVTQPPGVLTPGEPQQIDIVGRSWQQGDATFTALAQFDVHARVLPYYQEHILADLKAGRNVIVAAHGNSLRALMKHLDQVADDKVHELEIGTGEVHVYEISEDGTVVGKEIRAKGGKA